MKFDTFSLLTLLATSSAVVGQVVYAPGAGTAAVGAKPCPLEQQNGVVPGQGSQGTFPVAPGTQGSLTPAPSGGQGPLPPSGQGSLPVGSNNGAGTPVAAPPAVVPPSAGGSGAPVPAVNGPAPAVNGPAPVAGSPGNAPVPSVAGPGVSSPPPGVPPTASPSGAPQPSAPGAPQPSAPGVSPSPGTPPAGASPGTPPAAAPGTPPSPPPAGTTPSASSPVGGVTPPGTPPAGSPQGSPSNTPAPPTGSGSNPTPPAGVSPTPSDVPRGTTPSTPSDVSSVPAPGTPTNPASAPLASDSPLPSSTPLATPTNNTTNSTTPTPIDASPLCGVAYDCVARKVVCGNPATFAADPACVGKEAEAKQAIDCCKSSNYMVCGTEKPALNETVGVNDTIPANDTVSIPTNTTNGMCYEKRSASLVDRIRENDAFQKCMGVQQTPTDNRTCEVVYDCAAGKLKCGAPSLFDGNGTCKGEETLAAAQVKCGIKLHTIMCTSGLDANNQTTCNTAYMLSNITTNGTNSTTDAMKKCVADAQLQLAAVKQAGANPNSTPLFAFATTFAFIVGGLYATIM